MIIGERVHEAVMQLHASLRDWINLPPPPRLGASPPGYSMWFMLAALLLMTALRRPVEDLGGGVLQTARRLVESFLREFEVPVDITPPQQARPALMAGWLGQMSSATGNDNWCTLGGTKHPMDILRHNAPELEMACSKGHDTRYEVVAATDLLRKI